ncbi:unnamed protein product [Gadus morhua 'NCC']
MRCVLCATRNRISARRHRTPPGKMWGNRESVLALVVVAALHGTLNGAKELDMAVDSVDDRYYGCRADALKELPDQLKDELAASPEFKVAWETERGCNAVVPGGLPEHSQALRAYLNAEEAFKDKFNNAVATMGGNHSFPFYSLHFLLTDAMMLLSGKGGTNRTVYSVSRQLYTAKKGAKVKLGGFMSAFKDRSLLMEDPDLEGGVLFSITSCLAANLEMECGDVEMLLLPAEEFTVEDIHKVDDGEYVSHTSITLKHSGFSSKHNCHLHARLQKGNSSTKVVGCLWAVYLAVALFGLLK